MININKHTAVILDTSNSPYAQLKPVSIKNVVIDNGFWKSRILINQAITIKSQFQLLESTGRLDNFRRLTGIIKKPFQGYVFNDSDIYKWLEAASWMLNYEQNHELHQRIDFLIDLITSAQDKDGYINTYFSMDRVNERWSNIQEKHELYCAGHLIQAAIAHHRTTGEDSLLDVAIRLAEHIYSHFSPNNSDATPGHPEIEMALIELYRTTYETKYLELAKLFVNRRGVGLLGGSEYLIDHKPFRKLNTLAGHAVRALYLCSGVADIYLETGEQELIEALERLWLNMVHQQMYITGGVGSRHNGEAFGDPYELPNANAYAETCAAIANVMWNWRMLQISGNSKYADLLEWTLFNAVLPGISLSGDQYFYDNPLQSNGNHRRKPWFECACCPPNVSRTLAMLPGYIYSTSTEGLWVNLFASSTVNFEVNNGRRFMVRQKTEYPWDGHVTLEVKSDIITQEDTSCSSEDNIFSIFLRLPRWLETEKAIVKVNGEAIEYQSRMESYLEIHRRWVEGDEVYINFPVEVKFVEAHPMVTENSGKVTITRGPLVYCLEEIDNPGLNLPNIIIDTISHPLVGLPSELMDGLVAIYIQSKISLAESKWENKLYRTLDNTQPNFKEQQNIISFIPYFAWANRTAGQMQIWNRYK